MMEIDVSTGSDGIGVVVPRGRLNMVSAGRLREIDLEKHLLNEQDKEAEKRKKPAAVRTSLPAEKDGGAEDKKPMTPLEFASDKDFQFQEAMRFLKGQPLATAQTAQAAPPAAPGN